ncbi:3-oxoacyl-ACP synthase [Streptomyces sp. TR1341]|uniref:3-oxoacyl-ACP synthase n=1 Tax=Streptomyces sp. TR1341 TaxID=2601266 RepID=UPI00138AEC1F|nr:3-oxoacyl-ACP synthase [Streptomyces sp. TR1341]
MKFGTRLRIRNVVTHLPATLDTVADAVAGGRLEPDNAAKAGVDHVTVSDRASGPELAVAAARTALKEANWDPAGLDLVLHTWFYYPGHEMWGPAHYVADQVGAVNALPFSPQQGCNGGVLSLQEAALRLLGGLTGERRALITTGDRFCEPGFDRWRSDYSMAYGDSGTAALVHAEPDERDEWAVLSAVTTTAAELEGMLRGDRGFAAAPREHGPVVDIRSTKKEFMRRRGFEVYGRIAAPKVERALLTALDEAGLDAGDPRIRYYALPRLGDGVVEAAYVPVFEAHVKQAEDLRLGRGTGHLGCGDHFANLADMTGLGLVDPGDVVVLIGGGVGFTWTCVVVQAWPGQA